LCDKLRFFWDGAPADFTVSSTNEKVVYLWTPEVLSTTPFNFNVVNKADLTDTNARTINPDGGFSWARVHRDLFLASTNLEKGEKFNPGTGAATPLTFTFTRDIPDGAEVSARLAYSMTQISDNTNHDMLIPLTTSISGRTISITPTARLNYDTTYYLIFRVVVDGEQILGGTWYNNYLDILDVNTSTPRRAIEIVTGPDPTIPVMVTALAAANNNATSKELTVSGGNTINGGMTNLKSGRLYYVEFNGDILFTAPTNPVMLTDNANVTVRVARVSDTVMSVTYTIAGAGDPIESITGLDPSIAIDATTNPVTTPGNGRINVAGGLLFGNATIEK